jgi:predicted metal-binding membrane protein
MNSVERVIRRDRVLVALGFALVTALAWVYLVRAAAAMNSMAMEAHMRDAMGMADPRMWGAAEWVGLFAMWTVMMVGMMLPSAAPMMLLVLGVYRRRDDPQARLAAVAFIAGYVVVWTAFSAVAAAVQVELHRAAVLAADMRLKSAVMSGLMLIAAGVYQWLPLKNFCLKQCQSPLGFLSQHWREGSRGGFIVGLHHGAFCVGCCWLLMALLFVLGVMNLAWVAALAAFVLVEKLAVRGAIFTRLAGVAAAAWGMSLILTK